MPYLWPVGVSAISSLLIVNSEQHFGLKANSNPDRSETVVRRLRYAVRLPFGNCVCLRRHPHMWLLFTRRNAVLYLVVGVIKAASPPSRIAARPAVGEIHRFCVCRSAHHLVQLRTRRHVSAGSYHAVAIGSKQLIYYTRLSASSVAPAMIGG
jgi:hypothetical protein